MDGPQSSSVKLKSNNYLPSDLLLNILYRLPVKSLVRLRCVSKSWLSLIDSPDFSRFHLNTNHNNICCDENNHLFVSGIDTGVGAEKWWVFNSSCGTIQKLAGSEKVDQIGGGHWFNVGSIDGLILLMKRRSLHPIVIGEFNRPLMVWNPSIRKFREIPPLPEIEICPAGSSSSYLTDFDLGLEYDPLANDYRLVKLILYDRKAIQAVAVYYLKSFSWRIIKFGGNSSMWKWIWHSKLPKHRVYFQGKWYFAAITVYGNVRMELVSFDVRKEVFCTISMPPGNNFPGWFAVDVGGSLTVLSAHDKSLWMLDSESMNWTRRCSFQLEDISEVLCLKKNGDILAEEWRNFKNKGEKRKGVLLYGSQTGKYKILQQTENSFSWIDYASPYIESLILLK